MSDPPKKSLGLKDLSDLVFSDPINDGDIMKYDAGNSEWINVAPSADSTTASNVGVGGVGLFKQKTGDDLEFRNINAASNKVSVVLDAANNEADLDVVESNLTIANMSDAASYVTLTGAQTITDKTFDGTNDLLDFSGTRTMTRPDLSVTPGADDQIVTRRNVSIMENKEMNRNNNTFKNVYDMRNVTTISTTNLNIATDIYSGQNIGGHVVSTNQDVLLVGQTNKVENGVYNVVAASGPAPRENGILPSGARASTQLMKVSFGDYAGSLWVCTNANNQDTVDTHQLTYVRVDYPLPLGQNNGDILQYDGTNWVIKTLANSISDYGQLWSDASGGDTTITLANTWYDVVMDFGIDTLLSNFQTTAFAGELKYIGPGGIFQLQYTVGVKRAAGAAIVTYKLGNSINGNDLGTGITLVTTDAAGTCESVHHQVLVQLNTNDLIRLRILAPGHTDNANLTSYTAIITPAV